MPGQRKADRLRFGIGEWYGKLFHKMTLEERQQYAEAATLPGKAKPDYLCPFDTSEYGQSRCNKKGGVCSLRRYVLTPTEEVSLPTDSTGGLRTVCPKRFREDGAVYRWVGQTLLGCETPLVLGEIGFLSGTSGLSPSGSEDGDGNDVGRIDQVLIVPESKPLAWCALEVQAVYFQGDGMSGDFRAIKSATTGTLPFPVGSRRPDYRSSGPKRLMPQLQIKVPSLRRWGKKMAVVIDRDFFAELGHMDTVGDVSNCDIAWFVVKYEEMGEKARLIRDTVYLTTLERSVEGLTAGTPVSLEAFEGRILNKLKRQQKGALKGEVL